MVRQFLKKNDFSLIVRAHQVSSTCKLLPPVCMYVCICVCVCVCVCVYDGELGMCELSEISAMKCLS